MEFLKDLTLVSSAKLISFIFWAIAYIYVAVNCQGKSPEWCSRVIALLHGSIAGTVGLNHCRLWNYAPNKYKCFFQAHKMYPLMLWTWGYFTFDLLWCIASMYKEPHIYLHHLFSIWAVEASMRKNYFGCSFACSIAITEITNPLLQIRWFLKYEGCYGSNAFFILDLTFLGLFVLMRGFFGTLVIVQILKAPKSLYDIEVKAIALLMYGMSLMFLYQMYGYFNYKYGSKVQAIKSFFYKPEPEPTIFINLHLNEETAEG